MKSLNANTRGQGFAKPTSRILRQKETPKKSSGNFGHNYNRNKVVPTNIKSTKLRAQVANDLADQRVNQQLAKSIRGLSLYERDHGYITRVSPVVNRHAHAQAQKSTGKIDTKTLTPAPINKARLSPKFPRHFKRKKERNVAISQNALKNHVCSGRVLDAAMAQSISMKRARDISKNTVFQAPDSWDHWETSKGDRIVSAERVSTYQCKRKGTSNKWNVEFMGEKLAIFQTDWPHPNAHHLLAGETLNS